MDTIKESTAGILAILGAGGKVGQFCSKIVALKTAPEALQTLNDEVEEVQTGVRDVDELLRVYSETQMVAPPSSVAITLIKTQRTLSKLEKMIAYELETPSANNEPRVDKSVWLMAGKRIDQIRKEIRDNRIALASALNLLSW